MIRRDLLTGRWEPYLERAISLRPCYEFGINGGEVPSSFLEFHYWLNLLIYYWHGDSEILKYRWQLTSFRRQLLGKTGHQIR